MVKIKHFFVCITTGSEKIERKKLQRFHCASYSLILLGGVPLLTIVDGVHITAYRISTGMTKI